VKITPTTEKLGLGLTVTPVGVAAPVAPLASMPRVYSNHLTAQSLSFVFKEAFELSKAPGVKPSFSFPPRCLYSFPDVGEIFHDNSRTGFNAIKDRGGKNVVAIPSEALFTPSEASKMPLGGLGAIGLQGTSKAEDLFNNFLHMLIPMKSVIRSNSGVSNTKVNTDSLGIRDEGDIRQTNHDVQVELIPLVKQVGSSGRLTNSVAGILGNSNKNLHSALCRRQTHLTTIPIHFKSVKVISGWAKQRLGTARFSAMLQPGYRRFDSLRCFLASLDVQVGHKVGIGLFTISIGKAVKRIGITILSFPAHLTNLVKSSGELSYRILEGISLPIGRKQFNTNHSIHINIIPYILQIMQTFRKEVCRNSSVA